MKIKCDYCQTTYEDTLPQCPNCGAANPARHREDVKPRTIEELQQWYRDRHLPPEEVTRFFIGKNITEPKAFGIYKDQNGDFVVYKNKADGSRAIRYQGADEEYAVNELYLKLKDEIVHQKENQKKTGNGGRKKPPFAGLAKLLPIGFTVFLIISFISGAVANKSNGYYLFQGITYYCYANDWYWYDDDTDDWDTIPTFAVPGNMASDGSNSEYYQSRDWNAGINATDWDNSSFYDDYHSGSSDSDYDWDSDSSWDSGGTDWDTDW